LLTPRRLNAIDRDQGRALAQVWAAPVPLLPATTSASTRRWVVDVDARLVTAHSDQQDGAPPFKRDGGQPLCGFVDAGSDGTGEPLAIYLRPGDAGPQHRV